MPKTYSIVFHYKNKHLLLPTVFHFFLKLSLAYYYPIFTSVTIYSPHSKYLIIRIALGLDSTSQ